MPRFRLTIALAAAALMSVNLQGCVTASGSGLYSKDRANTFYTPLPQGSEAGLPALPPYVRLVRFHVPVTAHASTPDQAKIDDTLQKTIPSETGALDWLFSRDPDHHVIQLVSARGKPDTERYLEKANFTGNNHIFYASFPKSGSWWYAVYAQTFSSKGLAEAAAAKLPVGKDSYLVRPARVLVRHQCDNLSRLPEAQRDFLTSRCATWKRMHGHHG